MPKNVPPELEDKFKRCKEDVMAKGETEEAAYGICYMSVVEGKSLEDAMKSYDLEALKVGMRNSASDAGRLQAIHDLAVENGAQCDAQETRPQFAEVKGDLPGHEFRGNQWTEGGGSDGGKDEESQKLSEDKLSDLSKISKEDWARAVSEAKPGDEWVALGKWERGKVYEVTGSKGFGGKNGRYDIGFKPKGEPLYTEQTYAAGPNKGQTYQQSNWIVHTMFSKQRGGSSGNLVPVKSMDINSSLIGFGESVKSLGGGRVGGYLVRFGSPDQPDASQARDFFTPQTDFGVELPAKSATYFNHALTSPLKSRLSHDAELKRDDYGVWAETVLNERDRYEAFLLDMAAKGKLGWSSGTAQHLVERKSHPNGTHEITRWPLGLDASLTHMPAEPRNEVIPLKSLSDYLPELELPEAGEGESAPAVTESEGATKSIINPMEVEMEPNELEAMLERASQKGAEAALKSLPANLPAAGVQVVKDEGDQPWARPGDFFKAVKAAAFAPSQEDPRLRAVKASGMSEGIPADGGYLVPPQTATGILEHMWSQGEILRRISIDPVTSNNMAYNGVDETSRVDGSRNGGVTSYWVGEGGTLTTSKPKFWQLALKLKKIIAACYATDEQLEDTANLESWLSRVVPDELRFRTEDAIYEGDGFGKPSGIMNSPCLVKVLRADASKIQLADVLNMYARRHVGSAGYVWFINQDVTPQLNGMTAATAPVYLPPGGLSASPYGSLMGFPVIEVEYAQTMGTNGDILLASMAQYQAISKGGVKSASSIHVQFLTEETTFRFSYRIDGGTTWNSAVTPLHGTNTVSPFVSLASASV